MQRITYFANVIVPLAVPNLYTYRVPHEWNDYAKRGQRVIVPFGKSKYYTGIIESIHENPPLQYEAKYIEQILDGEPIINDIQFKLWEWIASYYMCHTGEVMNAALPSGLKLSSETYVVLSPSFDDNDSHLSDKELAVTEALKARHVLSATDVSNLLGVKSVIPVLKSLLEKRVVQVREEIKEKFKPKITEYVTLNEDAAKEENLKEIFSALEKRAFRQLELIMAYIRLADFYSSSPREVKKAELLQAAGATNNTLSELIRKNILEIYSRETGRLPGHAVSEQAKELSASQAEAFNKIKTDFKEKKVVLLHGVTSSGKTEIYVKLIQEAMASGKQVLYLLPEIALTTQIISRLQKIFGDSVVVYHSRFSENERVEVWNAVLKSGEQKKVRVILGARSALFLPFHKLGLVIVDEEHDHSYKQQDPAPRYNARDTAIFLAHLHSAPVLIGSATPAIESYHKAMSGKYGYIRITERFGGVQMPQIRLVNTAEESRKKLMKSHFSPALLEQTGLALEKKEQVILFQNRRGFSPYTECRKCNWIPHCNHCDVSLTYHKTSNQLRCHYCGYSIRPPSSCGACGSSDLKMKGFGTEKIEEELAVFFPQARISRMDHDTTRSKYAHHQIISDFEEHKLDILVGTQMVTKGLDFDNVSLVAILDADSMLHYPDFRSHERSFQLMAQVSGRAGRKNKQGLVLIQTKEPGHPVIQQVVHNNYDELFQYELSQREKFNYPPFCRLIEITLLYKEQSLLDEGSSSLALEMQKHFGKRVLGPEYPVISRIRNLFLKRILLKIETEASASSAKEKLKEIITGFRKQDSFKQIKVQVDVDPM